MEVFVKSLLVDRVKLSPQQLAKDYKDTVAHALRAKMEGRCTRHGYIRPNSIEVVKISPGALRMFSLNGDVVYTVAYKAQVCNPAVNSIVEAHVTNTNKFGVLAEVWIEASDSNGLPKRATVLEIIIAKQGAFASDDVHNVQVGDKVNVEILGKKFELNDKRISAVGKIVKRAPPEDVTPQSDATEIENEVEEEEEAEEDTETSGESTGSDSEEAEEEEPVEGGGQEDTGVSEFDMNDDADLSASLSEFDEAFEEDIFGAEEAEEVEEDDGDADRDDDESTYSI